MRVISRKETVVSPWVRLVEKVIGPGPDGPVQVYHCLAQADYVAILARTPSGHIPVVRQFRAAVGAETWEFPGGLLEADETPESCCRRELLEETGAVARRVHELGAFLPDTGRMENRIHLFFVEASEPDPAFEAEAGLRAAFVSPAELRDRILGGTFLHQLHLGLLSVATLRGFDHGVFPR